MHIPIPWLQKAGTHLQPPTLPLYAPHKKVPPTRDCFIRK